MIWEVKYRYLLSFGKIIQDFNLEDIPYDLENNDIHMIRITVLKSCRTTHSDPNPYLPHWRLSTTTVTPYPTTVPPGWRLDGLSRRAQCSIVPAHSLACRSRRDRDTSKSETKIFFLFL